MYLYLKLNEFKENEYYKDHNRPLYFLGPLNYINIFVGANNTGKSRFLRKILNLEEFTYLKSDQFLSTINLLQKEIFKLIEITKPLLIIRINRNNIDKVVLKKENQVLADLLETYFNNVDGEIRFDSDLFTGILSNLTQMILEIDEEGKNKHYFHYVESFKHKIEFLVKFIMNDITFRGLQGLNIEVDSEINKHQKTLINIQDYLSIVSKEYDIKHESDIKRVYIPVLRTAWKLILSEVEQTNVQILGTDIYKNTLKHYYGLRDQNIDIFTGMDLYEIIDKSKRHSTKEVIQNAEAFDLFLSQVFFESKKTRVIPAAPTHGNNEIEKQIKVDIDGDSYRELYNLGDGINTLIILIYKLFVATKNSWIFIEEPELNLHPAFQRIFLDTLLNNKFILEKNLKIFFTTHSNHLLDLSMTNSDKISIFTFEKDIVEENEKFYVKNIRKDNIKILNILGVNNASTFIANCCIWVEGITDREYIKMFLNAYLVNNKNNFTYKEDLHYSFFEYAGSNIEHYIFGDKTELDEAINLERINSKYLSNKILLIADRDKGKELKHSKRLKKISQNFKYICTDGKEIENYLSPILIKESLPKFKNKFKNVNINDLKIDQKDYLFNDMGLGEYLSKKLLVNINESSGTLNSYYKTRLPSYVKEVITWDKMDKSSQRLTKKIYEYIRSNN